VTAAMVGRALGRPAAEAVATCTAFVAALVTAQVAPSFVAAAGLLWLLPAIGGFMAWAWLGRTLHFGFVTVSDFVLTSAVALLTFWAARSLVSDADAPTALLVRVVAASGAAALLACLAELTRPDGRALARGLLVRLRPPHPE